MHDDNAPPQTATQIDAPGEVRRTLIAVVIARTGINAGIRVVYPFLPAIARGLGTSLERVADLTALTSIVGVMGPLAGRLAEQVGRRSLMLGGLVATLAGVAVIGLAPTVTVAAIGFVLIGFGKPGFDVPMQGWFGARVPYHRRGRVLGITELTWAGGLLASVPLSGYLIARTNWRIQFLVVAVLIIGGLIAVATLMTDDRPTHRVQTSLPLTRPRVAMLVVIFLFTFAAQGMFVIYGAWLEADLGLDVTGIGLFTLVVVAAELTGEGTVAAVGDRLGLRRSIIAALVITGLAYFSLGSVGNSLIAAIIAVVVWFIAFEITVVSSIPFVTELGGIGRDRLLGMMTAAVALARASAALAMPRIFTSGGIGQAGLVATACVAVAAVILVALVPEPQPAATL